MWQYKPLSRRFFSSRQQIADHRKMLIRNWNLPTTKEFWNWTEDYKFPTPISTALFCKSSQIPFKIKQAVAQEHERLELPIICNFANISLTYIALQAGQSVFVRFLMSVKKCYSSPTMYTLVSQLWGSELWIFRAILFSRDLLI